MTAGAILLACVLAGRGDSPADTLLFKDSATVPRPGNAAASALRGDACVADGRLREALDAYLLSSALAGESDPAVLKKVAVVQEWTREFTGARATLGTALRLNPEDDEARGMHDAIVLRRSLHVFGSAGGGEVDYTRNVQELGVFVGWVDRMDAYGGVSRTDRIFYRRTNLWADLYLFPVGPFVMRAGVRLKRYAYPAEINPRPDNSAYSRSVHFQLEGQYEDGSGNGVSLEVEYFRPEFFWNPALGAHNVKLGAEIRSRIAGPLYAGVFGAMLRTPDPDSFVMDASSGDAVSFAYETVDLIGATLGYDDGVVAGEVKYVPDRDLDRSLAWSVFGKLRFKRGRIGVQADVLFDRYAGAGARDVATSRVAMLTLLADPWDAVEVRAGLKALTRSATDLSPFLSLRLKTGL